MYPKAETARSRTAAAHANATIFPFFISFYHLSQKLFKQVSHESNVLLRLLIAVLVILLIVAAILFLDVVADYSENFASAFPQLLYDLNGPVGSGLDCQK